MCMNCGKSFPSDYYVPWRFCPFCGARRDLPKTPPQKRRYRADIRVFIESFSSDAASAIARDRAARCVDRRETRIDGLGVTDALLLGGVVLVEEAA